MRTQVRVLKDEDGVYVASSTGKEYWAEWKSLTVKAWDQISRSGRKTITSLMEIEKRMWEVLLEDSSLLEGVEEKHDCMGLLSKEAKRRIVEFVPAFIPSSLLRPLMGETRLSTEEIKEIERQCQVLWLGAGSTLQDPHPLLEKALTAMNFKESFGISSYITIAEMPLKEMLAFKLVSSTFSEIQETNRSTQNLRDQAKSKVGIH